MLLQRLGWGWALLGGCMDTPCTDGLGSFFQPDQGPRSHPSALSSPPVMAHPSSTKQCCASPWIQCHHAQPSCAAGCTQQGKEGCSRVKRAVAGPFSLPSSSFCSPLSTAVRLFPPSQVYPSVGIPSQVEGEKPGKKQPLASLGHPSSCCPLDPSLPLHFTVVE